MNRSAYVLISLLFLVAALVMPGRSEERPSTGDGYWVEAMRKVHARFRGQPGTFAQFGDSITVTQAFWSPLQQSCRNTPPAMEAALARVRAYLRPECWRDWKGPEFGSDGGQTVRWAHDHVAEWLKKLNPEAALIMFGSNDLRSLEVDEYRTKLHDVVRSCMESGTVVILSTIPPRHGEEAKAERFAAAARELAREMGVPLIDFYAEVLQRRPRDWDGALEQFAAYHDYDVPTLLSRDGVHPSWPQRYQNDYSEEALRSCGYGLRSYLALMKYAEVIRALDAAAPVRADPAPSVDARGAAWLPPSRPWFPKAPPLPRPRGAVIRVSDVEGLFAAAGRVRPGGTILLADGQYMLPRRLEIKTDRISLRGASGKRERVVLDGGNMGELVAVTACTGVTIADLTVQNVRWNGIKINSETGVQRLVIYNCILHNIWQRAVKGVMVPAPDREKIRPTGCRVQYCLFANDHPKRFEDDPTDTAQSFNGNYIGGIDVMFARDWIISDNVFIGIHGRTHEARGAVFLWHDTQGCVVERNIVIDCDSGICLGNSHRPEGVVVHCTGCIVRNNFVTRASENGILADYTRDCQIVHNTVHDPDSPLGRLIRLVHDNDGLLVANNLISGPPIRNESGSNVRFQSNVSGNWTAHLVDPASGNLRLTARAAEAIDHATPLAEVAEDIDRKPRGSRPDVGAHEFSAER